MFRTRQHRAKNKWGGVLKIAQIDQSVRAVARDLGVRWFTWGSKLEGYLKCVSFVFLACLLVDSSRISCRVATKMKTSILPMDRHRTFSESKPSTVLAPISIPLLIVLILLSTSHIKQHVPLLPPSNASTRMLAMSKAPRCWIRTMIRVFAATNVHGRDGWLVDTLGGSEGPIV